jgi:integrase
VPRNVCDAVTPPRVPKTEIKPLNARQAKNLLDTARDPQPGFYALYVLAVTTGMRSGEILGLQWQDVDLDAGTWQVRRTVFNGAISTPKTSRSNRGSDTPRWPWRRLEDILEALDGCLAARMARPLAATTCTTLLLSKGVHPKLVQELLGHSSIEITLDTYSHVLPSMGDQVAGAMDDILG